LKCVSALIGSVQRFEAARIEAAMEEEEALLSPPDDDADNESSTDVAVVPPSMSDLAVKVRLTWFCHLRIDLVLTDSLCFTGGSID